MARRTQGTTGGNHRSGSVLPEHLPRRRARLRERHPGTGAGPRSRGGKGRPHARTGRTRLHVHAVHAQRVEGHPRGCGASVQGMRTDRATTTSSFDTRRSSTALAATRIATPCSAVDPRRKSWHSLLYLDRASKGGSELLDGGGIRQTPAACGRIGRASAARASPAGSAPGGLESRVRAAPGRR